MTVNTEPTEAEKERLEMIQKIADRADIVGFWYAWGRLDQGHPPVLGSENDPTPNTTSTAWTFGRMYAEQKRAFAAGEVGFSHGVPSAWENFVLTEGKSIDRPRTQ